MVKINLDFRLPLTVRRFSRDLSPSSCYTRAMDEEDKSKSQIKREAKALQDLAVKLTQLAPNQLQAMPLPENILDAIEQSKKINSPIAKKRHIQLMGGLLLQLDDFASIQQAYHHATQTNSPNTAKHKLIENWRTRLLSDDQQALTEFMQQYHCHDSQSLRQLIRQARAERDQQKCPGAGKALFHLIKEIIA